MRSLIHMSKVQLASHVAAAIAIATAKNDLSTATALEQIHVDSKSDKHVNEVLKAVMGETATEEQWKTWTRWVQRVKSQYKREFRMKDNDEELNDVAEVRENGIQEQEANHQAYQAPACHSSSGAKSASKPQSKSLSSKRGRSLKQINVLADTRVDQSIATPQAVVLSAPPFPGMFHSQHSMLILGLQKRIFQV
ncbi:hypothetical protein EJ04DRAFT_119320 [Polyplosphaeria fusca]|uniref:Uncharacterized protein n=1 Tax=Polyplosphaeria fusca TaxID=682080 RepID=A0A9P4UWM7_9PLEO|nr:hypothetical protein EJ04DRAFT_119320 [Polyplosphaeria fusca]